MKDAERFERLKVDIDTRLVPLWALFWGTSMEAGLDEDARDLLGSLLRAAYGLGYQDAYYEEEGKRGELARANGYMKEEL